MILPFPHIQKNLSGSGNQFIQILRSPDIAVTGKVGQHFGNQSFGVGQVDNFLMEIHKRIGSQQGVQFFTFGTAVKQRLIIKHQSTGVQVGQFGIRRDKAIIIFIAVPFIVAGKPDRVIINLGITADAQ